MEITAECEHCLLTYPLTLFEKYKCGVYRKKCKLCRHEEHKLLKAAKVAAYAKNVPEQSQKICDICKITKDLANYNKRALNPDGFHTICRKCYNETAQKENKERRERRAKEADTTIQQDRIKICTTCLTEKNISNFKLTRKSMDGTYHICNDCWKPREWNKEKQHASEKRYNEKNPEKIKAKYQRQAQNPQRRIRNSLNSGIRLALASHSMRKCKKTMDFVGCDKLFLKQWFQFQFVEGMSLDNYGEWHIDHVTPCVSYDLTNEDEVKVCFNWKNLRPCWKTENLEKSDAIIPEVIESHKQMVNTFLEQSTTKPA
jgi:hypothetical protein